MAIKKKSMSGMTRTVPNGRRSNLFEGINPAELENISEKNLHDTDRFKTRYLPIDEIDDNTENRFHIANTEFLEKSIKSLGQLQPIIVLPYEKNGERRYEIKSGSRRYISLKNIVAEGEKNNKNIDKYKNAFCIVLPEGITKEEIEKVITETNTTTRQISVQEVFLNFDIIFEKNKDGSYKYIPNGSSKYSEGSKILKEMGFKFSAASVKDYLSIYTAHNKDIRKEFEHGLLTKRQALTISRMSGSQQDKTMENFKNMTENEIKNYLKNYEELKKETVRKSIRGIDAVSRTGKLRKQFNALSKQSFIQFSDDSQKDEMIKELDEIKKYIDQIETNIANS